MKESRRKIIEYIIDFMDKTLSFGCYIAMFEDGETEYSRYICVDEHFLYQDNPEWSLFMPEENQDYKIIGHYSLNAVIKYFRHHKIIINGYTENKLVLYINNTSHYIKNKPLDLYNQEEEEHLIKLIKLIGNT